MRQVGDTLVWLGLILVVAAVVYFTPRLANYVARRQDLSDEGSDRVVWRSPLGVVKTTGGDGW